MMEPDSGLVLEDGATRFRLERIGDEVTVDAETAWFRARTRGRLASGEAAEVAQRLRELHASEAGSYRYVATDNWGEIVFAMAKRGELHISIRLQSAPDYLDEVRLFLNLAQDALPRIANGFAALK